MDKRLVYWILGLSFVITFGIRLYFAFQSEYFNTDFAYFTLRQVEHIRNIGLPLYEDPLSFSGRSYIFLPLFHYTLAFFSLFMPVALVCKIVPNILASAIIFIVYMVVLNMTKNEESSVVAAILSGLVPIYFVQTLNSISIYSLSIPLTIIALHFFSQINIKKNPLRFIVVLCLLLLLHPSIYIMILALVIYLILLAAENIEIGKGEVEITLFSIFVTFWFHLLVFKQYLALHGYRVIWQNIPEEILSAYFSKVSLLEIIGDIGFITLVGSMVVLLFYIFRRKKKGVYLFAALGFSASLLLYFNIIEVTVGLIFIGISASVLFGEFLVIFKEYTEKSIISGIRKQVFAILIVLIIATSLVTAVNYASKEIRRTITDMEVVGMIALKSMTNSTSIVASTPEDGHYITYFTNRKVVMDTNFLLMEDAPLRFNDIGLLFKSAIIRPDILDKYNINYIYFSPNAKKRYNITGILYAGSCLQKRYDNGAVIIYENRCKRENED
ncbi:MAG: hypothetical protein QXK37_01410 [Candidatus Woesearchaeota archaeon]